MNLRAYFYDARGFDREIKLSEIDVDALGDETLLWVDVESRKPPPEVSRILGFELEAVERVSDKRPQLSNHGSYYRFSVDTAPRQRQPESPTDAAGNDDAPAPGSVRVGFVVSQRWIVTTHEAPVPYFERFRDQDKAETAIGQLTGQSLAAALLDWHLGEYFDEVSQIEATVDKLDERVLREPTSSTILGRMVALRRRVSKLRALLVGQRDVFYGMSRPDFALVTDSGAQPFYEALASRYDRAIDEVERCRDVVVGSFDLFTSRTSQQTNDLVKVLTFLTAIVGFCAAIAGLMGMNFKASLFDTGTTGFVIVSGGLFAIALVSLLYARHRRWI